METKTKNKTKTETKKKTERKEDGEHKRPWQEVYATPEEIRAMLGERVMLRYNEVRGRTEIHWLSEGLTIGEDEQGLLAIFGGDGAATDGYATGRRQTAMRTSPTATSTRCGGCSVSRSRSSSSIW